MSSSYPSTAVYAPGATGPRRNDSNPFSIDGEEEIGHINTPVGDVPFLFMALLAVLFILRKRRRPHTPQQ